MNCWEFKRCGREKGGAKVAELGVCPASTETKANGVNGGLNGGRICWSIAGTFCDGKIQGTHADKEHSCVRCDFYKKVKSEVGIDDMVLIMRA